MRTAIFDLDGTLAETAADLIGAANDLLRAEGLATLDYAETRSTAGRGGRALLRLGWERAGRPLSEDEVQRRYLDFLDAYAARIDQESTLYDGAVETLERLAAEGWALGVCTNKPERLAVELLDRLGVGARFAAILGADSVPARKPDPGHLLATIDQVGGDLARSVLIGDSETDRETARNAHCPVVLVSFGYSMIPADELAPDALIDHYRELIPALERVVAA